MEIPYYAFLIGYGLCFLAMVVFIFLNLYHLLRFGWFDFAAKINVLMFTAIVAVILVFTALFLKDISWLETFTIFDFDNITGIIK